MHINHNTSLRNCTSCQLCAAVCPKDAISISFDSNGFYRPFIDEERCVNCGICTKICYKFDKNVERYTQDKLDSTLLYGAYAKDSEVLKNTTSGGVADILAHQLMRMGYKCVGVIYDSEKDAATHTIASNEDDLARFRGSKYIQSYTLDAFKEIVANCKIVKYAVFGTPCHIYALDKYFRLLGVREQHILVDLYCHGCPSMLIWNKYINSVKRSMGTVQVDNANFRSKIKGWGSFNVEVNADGAQPFYSDYRHNEFIDLFFSDQLLNEACNDCLLRSTLAYTDIRLGDFWGKQYVMNDKGVSAVSLVTERAKILFESIAKQICYKEEHYDDFLPWQSWGMVQHPSLQLREKVFSQLKDPNVPLQQSIDTIRSDYSLMKRIMHWGKYIIHALPERFEKCIRWLYYKII